VLPTLAVILWTYGMYAVVRSWSRKKNGTYLYRSRGRRYGLPALMAGTGVALGVVLWLSLADKPEDHGLKLASFLGTVWAEGRPDKADSRQEVPQIKGQAANGQPAYVLLHPETPAAQLETEKSKPAPRRLQKPKLRKGVSTQQAKAGKPAGAEPKKDKLAAKSQPKNQPKSPAKKKPASPAAAPTATGG